MSRGFIAGLAGVALLLAGGMLLVLALERGPAGGAPGAPAGPRDVAVAGPAAVPRVAAPPAAASAPGVSPALRAPEAPPAPLPADVTARAARALESMRDEVHAGLAALDGRVRACHLAAPFQVELEALEGRVRIARVIAAPDPAMVPDGMTPPPDERAVACVRGALEGVIVSVPSARAGRRWEQPWPGAEP